MSMTAEAENYSWGLAETAFEENNRHHLHLPSRVSGNKEDPRPEGNRTAEPAGRVSI